jgi:hypothetical protein
MTLFFFHPRVCFVLKLITNNLLKEWLSFSLSPLARLHNNFAKHVTPDGNTCGTFLGAALWTCALIFNRDTCAFG